MNNLRKDTVKNRLSKFLSTLISAIFLFIEVFSFPSQALGSEFISTVRRGTLPQHLLSSAKLQKIEVPPELGFIDETYIGSRVRGQGSRNGKSSAINDPSVPCPMSHAPCPSKTILFIQDAHDSFEAQENIAKMIHHLVREYGIQTVYEEGFEGLVPTDEFFGFIQDSELKKKVSYYLMDKLRIGGAEYAHINREKEFQLIGVDHQELYDQNLVAYQEAAKRRRLVEKDLVKMHQYVQELVNRHLPQQIKKWIKLKKRYEEGSLDFMNYLERLILMRGMKKAENLALRYPNISLLLSAEGSDDPKVMEKVRAMRSTHLYYEMDLVENDLAKQYLNHNRDEKIFRFHKLLSLLKRLNRMEISFDEYGVIKDQIKGFQTRELAQFIVDQTRQSVAISNVWEREIQSAIRFYDTARARDSGIERKLSEFLENPDEEVAILVFGGFHKEAIKEILQDQGLSYRIVSPKISKTNPIHQGYYKQLMTKGYHDYEVPVLVSKAMVQQKLWHRMTQAMFRSEYYPLVLREMELIGTVPLKGLKPEWGLSPELSQEAERVRAEARSQERHNIAPKDIETELWKLILEAGVHIAAKETDVGFHFPTLSAAYDVIEAMEIPESETSPADGEMLTVVEAGNGVGIQALRIARARPHVKVIGIEYAPDLFTDSQKLLDLAVERGFVRRDQVEFKQGDLLNEEFEEYFQAADAVYYYGGGMRKEKLEDFSEMLTRNLRPGARAVEYGAKNDLKPFLVDSLNSFDFKPFEKNRLIRIFTRAEGHPGPKMFSAVPETRVSGRRTESRAQFFEPGEVPQALSDASIHERYGAFDGKATAGDGKGTEHLSILEVLYQVAQQSGRKPTIFQVWHRLVDYIFKLQGSGVKKSDFRVVEIGPGTGILSYELGNPDDSGEGYDVTGLDFEEAFVEVAQKNNPYSTDRVRFLLGDATNLDGYGDFAGVDDGSVHLFVMNEGLGHLPIFQEQTDAKTKLQGRSVRPVFQEVFRKLQPYGYFIINDYPEHVSGKTVQYDTGLILYSIEDRIRALEDAGFTIVRSGLIPVEDVSAASALAQEGLPPVYHSIIARKIESENSVPGKTTVLRSESRQIHRDVRRLTKGRVLRAEIEEWVRKVPAIDQIESAIERTVNKYKGLGQGFKRKKLEFRGGKIFEWMDELKAKLEILPASLPGLLEDLSDYEYLGSRIDQLIRMLIVSELNDDILAAQRGIMADLKNSVYDTIRKMRAEKDVPEAILDEAIRKMIEDGKIEMPDLQPDIKRTVAVLEVAEEVINEIIEEMIETKGFDQLPTFNLKEDLEDGDLVFISYGSDSEDKYQWFFYNEETDEREIYRHIRKRAEAEQKKGYYDIRILARRQELIGGKRFIFDRKEEKLHTKMHHNPALPTIVILSADIYDSELAQVEEDWEFLSTRSGARQANIYKLNIFSVGIQTDELRALDFSDKFDEVTLDLDQLGILGWKGKPPVPIDFIYDPFSLYPDQLKEKLIAGGNLFDHDEGIEKLTKSKNGQIVKAADYIKQVERKNVLAAYYQVVHYEAGAIRRKLLSLNEDDGYRRIFVQPDEGAMSENSSSYWIETPRQRQEATEAISKFLQYGKRTVLVLEYIPPVALKAPYQGYDHDVRAFVTRTPDGQWNVHPIRVTLDRQVDDHLDRIIGDIGGVRARYKVRVPGTKMEKVTRMPLQEFFQIVDDLPRTMHSVLEKEIKETSIQWAKSLYDRKKSRFFLLAVDFRLSSLRDQRYFPKLFFMKSRHSFVGSRKWKDTTGQILLENLYHTVVAEATKYHQRHTRSESRETEDPATRNKLLKALYVDYFKGIEHYVNRDREGDEERIVAVGAAGPAIVEPFYATRFTKAYFVDHYKVDFDLLSKLLKQWDQVKLNNPDFITSKFRMGAYFVGDKGWKGDFEALLVKELWAMGLKQEDVSLDRDNKGRVRLTFNLPGEEIKREIVFVPQDMRRNMDELTRELKGKIHIYFEKGSQSEEYEYPVRMQAVSEWLVSNGILLLNPFHPKYRGKFLDLSPVLEASFADKTQELSQVEKQLRLAYDRVLEPAYGQLMTLWQMAAGSGEEAKRLMRERISTLEWENLSHSVFAEAVLQDHDELPPLTATLEGDRFKYKLQGRILSIVDLDSGQVYWQQAVPHRVSIFSVYDALVNAVLELEIYKNPDYLSESPERTGFYIKPEIIRQAAEKAFRSVVSRGEARAQPDELSIPGDQLLHYEWRDLRDNRGFIASNEYGWFEQEIDERPAEIFAGFGNNAVWDYAVRRNAKAMVIADHDGDVIKAQEFLYKPLLLIAKSRAEFLSMLAAAPIDEDLENASLEEIFDEIDFVRTAYSKERTLPGVVSKPRPEFIREIVERIRAHPELDEAHARFVEKHLNWVSKPHEDENGIDYDGAFDFQTAISYGGIDAYPLFRNRYHPGRLVSNGAGREFVHQPFFSAFSSNEAFQRLKRLFEEGNVYYLVADIRDRRAYDAIRNLSKRTGMNISGLYIGNIVDFWAHGNVERVASLMMQIIELTFSRLNTDDTFTLYHTLAEVVWEDRKVLQGQDPIEKRTYEVIQIPAFDKARGALKAFGYPADHIDSRLDYDVALEIINRVAPTVEGAGKDSVRLDFGGELYVPVGLRGVISASLLDDQGKPAEPIMFSSSEEWETFEGRILSLLEDMQESDPGIEAFLKQRALQETWHGQAGSINELGPEIDRMVENLQETGQLLDTFISVYLEYISDSASPPIGNASIQDGKIQASEKSLGTQAVEWLKTIYRSPEKFGYQIRFVYDRQQIFVTLTSRPSLHRSEARVLERELILINQPLVTITVDEQVVSEQLGFMMGINVQILDWHTYLEVGPYISREDPLEPLLDDIEKFIREAVERDSLDLFDDKDHQSLIRSLSNLIFDYVQFDLEKGSEARRFTFDLANAPISVAVALVDGEEPDTTDRRKVKVEFVNHTTPSTEGTKLTIEVKVEGLIKDFAANVHELYQEIVTPGFVPSVGFFGLPQKIPGAVGFRDIETTMTAETGYVGVPGKEVSARVVGKYSLAEHRWEPHREIILRVMEDGAEHERSFEVERPRSEYVDWTLEKLVTLMKSKPDLYWEDGNFNNAQIEALQTEFNRSEARSVSADSPQDQLRTFVATDIRQAMLDVKKAYSDEIIKAQMKDNKTIVTVADHLVQLMTVVELNRLYPDDGFLGEEKINLEFLRTEFGRLADLGHSVLRDKYEKHLRAYEAIPQKLADERTPRKVWRILDPVDGTSNYRKGHPMYGYSLARLVWDDARDEYVPEAGILYAPEYQDAVYGGQKLHGPMLEFEKGEGIRLWQTSGTGIPELVTDTVQWTRKEASRTIVMRDSKSEGPNPYLGAFFDSHSGDYEVAFKWDSSVVGLIEVILGNVEIYGGVMQLWDHAAALGMIQVLGGKAFRADYVGEGGENVGRELTGYTQDDIERGKRDEKFPILVAMGKKNIERVETLLQQIRMFKYSDEEAKEFVVTLSPGSTRVSSHFPHLYSDIIIWDGRTKEPIYEHTFFGTVDQIEKIQFSEEGRFLYVFHERDVTIIDLERNIDPQYVNRSAFEEGQISLDDHLVPDFFSRRREFHVFRPNREVSPRVYKPHSDEAGAPSYSMVTEGVQWVERGGRIPAGPGEVFLIAVPPSDEVPRDQYFLVRIHSAERMESGESAISVLSLGDELEMFDFDDQPDMVLKRVPDRADELNIYVPGNVATRVTEWARDPVLNPYQLPAIVRHLVQAGKIGEGEEIIRNILPRHMYSWDSSLSAQLEIHPLGTVIKQFVRSSIIVEKYRGIEVIGLDWDPKNQDLILQSQSEVYYAIVPMNEDFQHLTRGDIGYSLSIKKFAHRMPIRQGGIIRYQDPDGKEHEAKIVNVDVSDVHDWAPLPLVRVESSDKRFDWRSTEIGKDGWLNINYERNPFGGHARYFPPQIIRAEARSEVGRMPQDELRTFVATDNRQAMQEAEEQILTTDDGMLGRTESRVKTTEKAVVSSKDVVALSKDTTFVIGAAAVDNLSRAEWLELIALKLLNNDKLHILIYDPTGSYLSDRVMELRRHKKVYQGTWYPALPKDATTIYFSPFDAAVHPRQVLGERIRKLIEKDQDHYFGIAPGMFGVALLVSAADGQMRGLTKKNGLYFDSEGVYTARVSEILRNFEVVAASA